MSVNNITVAIADLNVRIYTYNILNMLYDSQICALASLNFPMSIDKKMLSVMIVYAITVFNMMLFLCY